MKLRSSNPSTALVFALFLDFLFIVGVVAIVCILHASVHNCK
jgi:hypothetical protein